jgi:hypothetical protein
VSLSTTGGLKMRKLKFVSAFVLLALLLSVIPDVTTAQDREATGNEVVFSVPIGSGSGDIGYEGLHEEMLPWGPTALAVDEHGTFYLLDGANNRIQRYDATGSPLSSIDFNDEVIGVTDIEVDDDNLLVLDTAATRPAVHRLGMDGALVQSYPIPKRLGEEGIWEKLSGIRIGPSGEVYVVLENGYAFLQLTDQTGGPLTTPRITADFQDAGGRTFGIQSADWSTDPHRGEVLVRSRSSDVLRITIRVPHTLGGLRYLQTGRDGSFFVVVEELLYDGSIHVDQTVRHYGYEGTLLDMARTPLSDFYTPVEDGITVGPDGNVYALVPKQDRVEIQRLAFKPGLEPIFSSQEPVVTDTSASTSPGTLSGIRGCRSRSAMLNVALGYYNNTKYLSSTNTDGTCANRTKPRYIGGAGNYVSVAYDAHGWDTVGGYNSKMYPGTYQAGDISFDDGTASCSRGADCSGFVTRVWDESSKLYTWTIPDHSTELDSFDDLFCGDVLNKPYYHVAMFYTTCGGGALVYHSTTYGGYDRVIKRCHSWSYFNGYEAREYDNVCP